MSWCGYGILYHKMVFLCPYCPFNSSFGSHDTEFVQISFHDWIGISRGVFNWHSSSKAHLRGVERQLVLLW